MFLYLVLARPNRNASLLRVRIEIIWRLAFVSQAMFQNRKIYALTILKLSRLGAAICLAAVPSLAQSAPPAVDGAIEHLKPGEFIWAKLLYGITKLGLTVVITDDALAPEVAPTPMGLYNSSPSGVSDGTFSWKPEKSPSGPVSIIISDRDSRIVVFRNGIEIGSGAVRIDGPVVATEAFTLRAVDVEGAHWMRLPLPGAQPLAAGEMSSQEHGRVSMPEAFRNNIKHVLQPGTTLLVTRDSLRSSCTGKHLTVIVAEDQ
jgi:hypothetical protein